MTNFCFNKKIKNIIIFGYTDILEDIIKINNKFKCKTFVVTSSDLYKKIKNIKNVKVFNKFNLSLKKYINKIDKNNDTFYISIGSRFIFTKDIINKIFKNQIVNFHSTRLPYHKGGGGYTWRILQNDKIDNQLVHLIDENIDTGKILLNKKSLFPKECIYPSEFESFSNNNFIKFYLKFITKVIKNHNFEIKNSVKYLGSYYPRINQYENSYLDWNLKGLELINMINAFEDPYCGVTTFLNRRKVKVNIKKAQLHSAEFVNHPYTAGIVLRHDTDWIVVSTSGKECLIIEKVLNTNNKNILSGIKEGDRFYTPHKFLEKNYNSRVFYNSKGIKK